MYFKYATGNQIISLRNIQFGDSKNVLEKSTTFFFFFF